MKENFIVYCIENTINNKLYIGITTKKLDNRWRQHLEIAKGGKEKYPTTYSYIHKAINKHGANNFSIHIVKYCENKSHMVEMEKYWIAEMKKFNISYNLTDGGEGILGYKYTEKQCQDISDRMKGLFSGDKNPFFGQSHTDETKKILSDQMIKRHSNKEFIGENHSHSKLTNEIILNIKIDYHVNDLSEKDIAKKYQIERASISGILREITWSHIKIDQSLLRSRDRNVNINKYWEKKNGPLVIFEIICKCCKNIFAMKERENSKKAKNLPKFCSNYCKIQVLSGKKKL